MVELVAGISMGACRLATLLLPHSLSLSLSGGFRESHDLRAWFL